LPEHAQVVRGRERRAAIVKFVVGYHAGHGYAPTISEVARGVGLSRSTTHQHLRTLRGEGRIRWVEGGLRTITIVEPGPAGEGVT
jgi:SOS-response transcriptional repressor LexA